MDIKSIIAEMKDILNDEYYLKLSTIIDYYERMKKNNWFLNKLSFNKYNEERAKNIPKHSIYFVKVLIDNIIYLFEKEKNIDNNLYLHIVIGYLFKIVLSKFNFIPSHKLVIIIYQYLCNSLKKFIKGMNLNDEIEKINKDFCFIYHLFEDEIINEKNRHNNINEKQDFENNLEEFKEFYDTEECFQNPCFKFFIKFEEDMKKLKQYFFILILNYLKIIDNDERVNYYILLFYLNKNYFSEIEIAHIDKAFKNIENVDELVVENKNVLYILKYSLIILNAKEIEDIKKITNELISFESTKPKVTDCFDDTNIYYEDLLNEFLYKVKNLEKIPKINSRTEIKNYWCSIIELLSILIQPKDLENNIVKIIFYFIVKLIDVDLDFLVKKDFLSNNLYTLLDVIFKDKSELLLYPEISYLLNNNQDIYNFFLCDKNEEYFYLLIENDIENMNLIFQQDDIYKNMKKFKFRNIFISMIAEYVAEKYLREISGSIIQYNKFKSVKNKKDSLNIFYNVYLYYHRFYSKEYHLVDLDLKVKDFNSTDTYIYMNKILNDQKFLDLLESIMNSQVMNEAYKEINKLDKDYIEQIKDNKNNKYDKYDIYTEYFKFIQNLKKIIKKNIFILMQLSSQFKGITCRFLKIIINSEDIFFNKDENTEDDNIKLISAYLIFIIIHEFNHLIKRYYKIGNDKDDAITPRQNEGGKEIINLLFGHHLLNRNINITQAKYILNISNWNMKNIKAFREEYSKISTVTDDKSISFLFSGEEDICYYGFIKPEN